MENFAKMLGIVFHSVKEKQPNYTSIEIYTAVNKAVNTIHKEEIQAFLIKTKKGESKYCNQCGRCCKDYYIFLSHEDKVRFEKDPYNDKDIISNGMGLWKFKNKPCKYLKSDGKCGCYYNRPISCQNYPLTNLEYPRVIRDPECMFCVNFFIDKSISILTKEPFM